MSQSLRDNSPFSCLCVCFRMYNACVFVCARSCGIQRVILGIILYSFSTSFFPLSVKPREIAAHKLVGSGELQVVLSI